MIRLDGVSRRWPEFAIRDITLEVKPGQYLAVVGPTGAGKTLLLELLLGIYQPDRGRVWIGGKDVTGEAPERRGIAIVYQDYLLFPHLTVEQNLEFGLRYGPDGEAARKRKVRETAKLLGVDHLLARYESTLSGGEKQRVALGRALITGPRVLLLDEPLSSLDRGTARRLRGELKALHAAKGLTTIHVTHDLSEARQLGDAIALIHEGELHAAGTPDDLLRRPPTLFAAKFGGALNLFPASTRSGGLVAGPIVVQGDGSHVMVRPDEVLLRAGWNGNGANLLRGEIVAVVDEGNLVEIRVRVDGLGEALRVHTGRQTVGEQGLVTGALVTADVSGALHVVRG